ncbi:uncharacterized protein [Pyxicephalus adspersus]|uniref:uncharacterized protein n=1 Tax=Pyxicephalus adspersus TaxID=30357 RepID=UPI003B595458
MEPRRMATTAVAAAAAGPATTTTLGSPVHRPTGSSLRPARLLCEAGQVTSRPLSPQPGTSASLSRTKDSASKATSFTPEQNAALMESYVQHFPRLRGGLHSQTSHAVRQELWEESARSVNAVGSTQRTITQCQKRLSDIFRHVKRLLGTEAGRSGTYREHLVQRLRKYERLALPFIGTETVVGVDYRDDSDAWQPIFTVFTIVRPKIQKSPPALCARGYVDDEDVTSHRDDTRLPPDHHLQEEVVDPLQRSLEENTEHPCLLVSGSEEFSQAASTVEGPSGEHLPQEKEETHEVSVTGHFKIK